MSIGTPSGTAYHEAGHAVMLPHFGRTIRRVTIVASESYRGMCDCRPSSGEQWRQYQAIYCTLAGIAAEHMGTGTIDPDGATVDLLMAGGLLVELDGVFHQPELIRYYAHVCQLIQRNWPRVEALAQALMVAGDVDGNQVRAIIAAVEQNWPV